MNIARIVIAGFGAAAVMSACATMSSSSGSGSNSNWLAVCAKSSDCTAPLECWCGVCTKACTTSADCDGLANGSCSPDSASLLCGAPAMKLGCEVACKDDLDCRSLGEQGRCANGACIKGSFGSDGGDNICKRTPDEATGQFLTLLANADHSCALDSDCSAGPGVSCGSPCGFPYVSKAGFASIGTEIQKIEKELCDPYFAAGCQTPLYFGCNLGDPICVKGTCENSGGILGSGTNPDGGTITCDERKTELGQRVQAHVDRADRACSGDADCTFIYLDFRCYHACDSGPLSNAGAAALTSELDALGTEFCPAFEAAGCRMDVPPCVPFSSADGAVPVKCVSNVCEYVTPH